MKVCFNCGICYTGKPANYAVVDKYVSRSAQPLKEDLAWLKEQGVTDIFNFRTMHLPEINYDEAKEVERLGMKYHQIPSISREPSEENIERFLEEIEEVKKNNKKAHIHCKSGSDRTGMYAFIYKIKNGIGTLEQNQKEWFDLGYHYKRYPNLMNWTTYFVNKFKK